MSQDRAPAPGEAAPTPLAGELAEIQTILDQVREGSLGEEVGFEAIARIARRRRVAAATFQKPWG